MKREVAHVTKQSNPDSARSRKGPSAGLSRAARLRKLLGAQTVTCLGVHDVISAHIAEHCRAQAVYISGYAASAVTSFSPDLGLMTQTEMYDHVARLCDATSLPAIADADTGYGDALNVQRTIRLWERAGAAGLHLEDQSWPKRCGHGGKASVVPASEMQQKIRAAADARNDDDFLLIARTDCIASEGAQAAIDRCGAYAEAGADALFVNAPQSLEQVRAVAQGLAPLGRPLVFNAARTGRSPFLSVHELADLGFGLILFPVDGMLAGHAAIQRAYREILDRGSIDRIAGQLTSTQEFNDFLGLSTMLKLQSEYILT